jgi:hypothetical protein
MEKMLQSDGRMKLVLCGCGKLHMTCGSVTVHFTRDEFQAFAESVRRIAAIIAQPSASGASTEAQDAFSGMCH